MADKKPPLEQSRSRSIENLAKARKFAQDKMKRGNSGKGPETKYTPRELAILQAEKEITEGTRGLLTLGFNCTNQLVFFISLDCFFWSLFFIVPVFGVPLDEVVSRDGGYDSIPRIIFECIAFIETYGLKEEGLYRIPGRLVMRMCVVFFFLKKNF
jgi:hypothetical protein